MLSNFDCKIEVKNVKFGVITFRKVLIAKNIIRYCHLLSVYAILNMFMIVKHTENRFLGKFTEQFSENKT